MSWFEIAELITPELRNGDIDTCIKRVTEELLKIPATPFHEIIKYRFTNKPEDVANYIRVFIENEKQRLDIEAIYIEMNGFDINPDLWFFDLFAFDTYGGHDDYDWLSDWKSDDHESMTLTGLEDIQTIYENYNDGAYEDVNDCSQANDICSLLIVLHFQDLIKKSAALIENLEIPVFATAHDFDFIYEYKK